MVDQSLLSDNISLDKFKQLLDKYNSLIESISSAKPAKSGQKTLVELDQFRYDDAVNQLQSKNPERQMRLEDIKALVDWKLRHGKFRTTLMKLVSSNDEELAESTIQEAMDGYWTDSNVAKALNKITKLKGIGPATGSLLLSVHDPDRVIFFSDEAFYWLYCKGQKPPIKYTAKEYEELDAAARALIKRLGVGATDIEKVAYVLIKEGASESASVSDVKLEQWEWQKKQAESQAESLKKEIKSLTEELAEELKIHRESLKKQMERLKKEMEQLDRAESVKKQMEELAEPLADILKKSAKRKHNNPADSAENTDEVVGKKTCKDVHQK